MINKRWLNRSLLAATFLLLGSLTMAMAQPEPPAVKELPDFMNSLQLTEEQRGPFLQLSKDFIIDLQKASQELAGLLVPAPGNAQIDPQTNEKISVIQQQFGVKMEKYHLDLADLVGDQKADQVMEKVQGIVPQVILQGSRIAAGSHSTHGSTATGNNTGDSALNNMPGMPNMPGMTNNTPGMTNNNQNQAGPDTTNQQILTQLLSYNTMLMQLVMTVAGQKDAANLPALAQPIYQIIVNQSSLIQTLFINLQQAAVNSNSGNSNGMGMM